LNHFKFLSFLPLTNCVYYPGGVCVKAGIKVVIGLS